MQRYENLSSVMEARDHFKNGASLKSLMSRGKYFISTVAIISLMIFSSCGTTKTTPVTRTISLNSEPTGAKVVVNGAVVCISTPCSITIPLSGNTEFTFIKDGYVQGTEFLKPSVQWNALTGLMGPKVFPEGTLHVFHTFAKQAYAVDPTIRADVSRVDPTIRAGEATNMVTRDKPGSTALERTIIRWYFDSDPRGARIFWRVISSVPDQVKNTNESYLTTTPYEETRSFNILGLTYENSRDVVIEIKVTRPGYMDQVKRYNVRQAIDQQEISGFFDMVKQ